MEKAKAVPSANARVVQIEIRQAAVERKFLGMFENVANTTNCVNQWSRGVMIHFAAQTVNVNIDDIGCGVNPHLPDMVRVTTRPSLRQRYSSKENSCGVNCSKCSPRRASRRTRSSCKSAACRRTDSFWGTVALRRRFLNLASNSGKANGLVR